MRVKLSAQERYKLFSKLEQRFVYWHQIAKCQRISVRTLRDWGNGKYLLPLDKFRHFVELCEMRQKDFKPEYLDDFWNIKDAAHKGGYESIKRYGNPGTLEGRRLGGKRSVLAQRKNPSGLFRLAKVIKKPKRSSKLAELMGIVIGDGHLSEWQVDITTNAKTDREHAEFVQDCFKRLFNISSFRREREDNNSISIVVSSKRLVRFINHLGMPIGNKLTKGLSIPSWIYRKEIYRKSFLRGLFDTDGCIYIDRHRANGKEYSYYGWVITSASQKLIKDVIGILKSIGFNPTHAENQKSLFLRKQSEIKRYFQEINTHNPKHLRRYNYGRVPKRS